LYPLKKTLIFLVVASIFFGCGEKRHEKEENFSFAQKEEVRDDNTSKSTQDDANPITKPGKLFIVSDGKRTRTLYFTNDGVETKPKKAVTVLSVVDARRPFSEGMLPYLADLERKHPQRINVIALALRSDDNATQASFARDFPFTARSGDVVPVVRELAERNGYDEGVLPVPLTVVYVNGRFFKRYEGLVPVEMVRHDIDAKLSVSRD
jgi:hypothetical protein